MAMANKILIIEDNDKLQKALKQKLKRGGYEVLEAVNGEEGLRMALELHPDLIFLDILMPVMNGDKVLEKLRADEWGKTAKVIVLSNLHLEDTIKEEYLIKSDTSLAKILERVKKRLGDKPLA